ncbi:MAG: hypothetical protein HZY79_15130 [Rhodoblastus sp.]|nr:MAG: hypothetical protein HZY79_15130 [Rhodoblastus sp.]
MSAARLSEPAVEPASVADLRDWLRADAGVEDAILANLVAAARQALEGHTRRAFISQEWRFTYLSCGADGLMRLPLGPLRSVAAIRCYDADGVATTLPSQAVAMDQDDQRPAVRVLDAAARARSVRFEVDVVVGYGDDPASVPAPLRQAILMLATNWHARRGDHPEIDLTIPRAVTALVASFRRVRLS